MSLTRRNLMQMIPAAAAAMSLNSTRAEDYSGPHRVIVVGGGFSGCTVAKYLRMWSSSLIDGPIEVTLVEPRKKHVSCVMSNLVLNEQLNLGDITFDYEALQAQHGVEIVRDKALKTRTLEGGQQQLKLKNGGWRDYDSIVFAAGIKFKKIPGLDSNIVPHAWIAGTQTNLLRDQIRDMPDDGTFVMTIPPSPYRCPPGPYERACVVASILQKRGGNGKVTVLDANPDVQAEKETFLRAFDELYGDIITYIPNQVVTEVFVDEYDPAIRSVHTRGVNGADDGIFSGDVINVIPPHKANQVLAKCGLVKQGWAPVNPVDYSSTIPGVVNTYIIGDAQGTGQPKSGHMANSQAKICADAIVRVAANMEASVYKQERLDNIKTNSACFSPITENEASWLTAVWQYHGDGFEGSMDLVPGSLGAAHGWNSENYQDMFSWSENLFADTFR